MHTVKLVSKSMVAEGTMQFVFEKPAGFVYQAGQTIDMTLVNPSETDEEGNMRTFSLTSSPQDAHLSIATRMRDTAFKRTLRDMAEGSEVQIDGPFGSFLLHENTSRPAVFLAGGIGVTPFHSMVKDAAKRHLPHSVYLFFSNRRPEDAAFLADFQEYEKENSNFKLVATMTDMPNSVQSWYGEEGYITKEMVEKYVPQDSSPVYYLAGPQTMVTAMRTLLTNAGISGDDIRFEEFAGY